MNLNDIPPFGFRIMSRLTVDQIVARSLLSKRTVQRVSLLKSWNTVTYGVYRQFTLGCGFIPDKPPHKQWQKVCNQGLSSVKHLAPKSTDRPWQAGVKANRIKSISSVVQ